MSVLKRYSQIEVHSGKEPSSVGIYLNMPFLKRPLKKATLYKNGLLKLTSKSSINIFKMFGPGVGLNEEMILKLNFTVIECEINGEIYRTTRNHLKEKAIRSPYQSRKVDRQWILRLEDFHLPIKKEVKEPNPSLFPEVV